MIREEIYSYIQTSKKPVSVFEISDYLKREKKLKSKNIVPVLQELESEGIIIQTRKNKYATPEQLNLVVGTIRKNPKGFGFLVCDTEGEPDIFIPGSRLRGALHMDHVIVRLFHDEALPSNNEGRHREGEVIRIIERYKDEFVGTFYRKKGYQFVVPDDPLFSENIRVNVDKKVKIKSHDKVLVKIKHWPEYANRMAKGKIIEILGNKDEVGMDVRSLIYQHGLNETFPDEVHKETKRFSKKILPKERERRIDYRHLPIVTIDGADSKDLDDGVYLEKTAEGYCLSVHIADVGHYVPERSILDEEAFKRGTSVYLVDRVLPMLPPILSNDLCSLNSGEERLALTCVMLIDFSGNIISHSIEESIIKVRHRLTYEDVNEMLLRHDRELSDKYADILPMLKEMAELQGILNKKRLQYGSIDFNIPESKIILDKRGKPIEIRFRKRELAERIIEEFMIAANITVAKHFKELEIPFIYRVHEKPDMEKVDFISGYLEMNGINLLTKHEEIRATDYQAILKSIEDTEMAYPVSVMLLRSMKHAYYSTHCIGHFGLGLLEYTHFTSPIRRYSDLAIHRVIKEYLKDRSISDKRQKKLENILKKYAEQASHKEIGAEEIERNSVSMKKAEFMSDKIGEVYPARIVSVTGFGFFVQLENSVEGLVHISSLIDDFYGFDENQLRLIGENTHRQFKIGDMVYVKLVHVNISETKIDFELHEKYGE